MGSGRACGWYFEPTDLKFRDRVVGGSASYKHQGEPTSTRSSSQESGAT